LPDRLAAVLLDRDGTINVKAAEGDYITGPEQLSLLPGAARAIRALNVAAVPAVVVTNQRGIALGRMDEDDLAAVHARLSDLLAREGAALDAIFHCPHDKGVCQCRKPGIGLLRRAQEHLGLSTLRSSVMVGDSESDVLAGRRAGAHAVWLGPRAPGPTPGVDVAPDLLAAVATLLPLPAID
jgi:D-glycero-D-manno-heptose 1,7-bisphosphate phosphatase